MKKRMVGAIVVILLLCFAALFIKVKWDIASALDSRYAVLFLDEGNNVDFAVAGDVHMFDDIVGNSFDNRMEKDGVSVYDAVAGFGDEGGQERIRAILAQNGIHVDGVVLASDVILASVYPVESVRVEGTASPLFFARDEVISLYRGEVERVRVPLDCPHGTFFTSQTDFTRDRVEELSFQFQAVLMDPVTHKSGSVVLSGNDLETLSVEGALTKQFVVTYITSDSSGRTTPSSVSILATVTLEDVLRNSASEILTVNQSARYDVVVDASTMVDIMRESESAPIDPRGNHKVKAWILDMFPRREVDSDLVLEIARQYRAGKVRVFPQNLTLRLLKVLPDSTLESLIKFFWPSSQA